MSARLRYHTYNREKIATPDYWTQIVFVHSSIDKYDLPESVLVQAIMRVWRAGHE